VSSNVGGINDLIINGETGFLFEPGDFRKLAEQVITLIENPNLRNQLGEKLYTIAKEKFSIISMGKTQLQIYHDIIKKVELSKESRLKYDIILSGYYGFDNLGDDAMLLGIMDSLKQYNPHLKILILSHNPMQTRIRFGHNSINRMNILKIFYSMMKSHLFINGGGNLIQDNTSTRSLLYYLATISFAKLYGMKVMIYGNGIGPLNKEFDQKLSAKILNSVDVITLREEISKKVLEKIKVTKPQISITADPAFTLEISTNNISKNILFEEDIPTDKKLIGFCIRKWPEDGLAAEELAKICDYITENYNTTSIFIPMHYPYDIEASKIIVSKMKNKAYVISNKYNISEVLNLISQLDFLIGMRLHSLIFAVKFGVPVIGISYEPKVDGFLKLIGQTPDINIKNINFTDFKNKFDILWKNKDQMRLEIIQKNKDITCLAKNNSKFVIDLLKDKRR
jgi:polysaccharide pyruvyl transferase CsaB